MSKKSRSPLRWYGGKAHLAPALIELIPHHRTYVEVFGGAAHLYFAKPPSPVEVINDLDLGLVTFYRVLRDPQKFRKLQEQLELTPYSRHDHFENRATWAEPGDDIEQARRWFMVARSAFGGILKGGFSWSRAATAGGMSDTVNNYLSTIELLPECHARTITAQVEYLDFRKLFPLYDTKETFFYADPPYIFSTRGRAHEARYNHEMSDEDHKELVEILLNLKGLCVLSGYQHPIYNTLTDAGWELKSISVKSTAARPDQNPDKHRTEAIWICPRTSKRLTSKYFKALRERSVQA